MHQLLGQLYLAQGNLPCDPDLQERMTPRHVNQCCAVAETCLAGVTHLYKSHRSTVLGCAETADMKFLFLHAIYPGIIHVPHTSMASLPACLLLSSGNAHSLHTLCELVTYHPWLPNRVRAGHISEV